MQWHNVQLRPIDRAAITVDKGALHEIGGRLELGPPKTPASVRTVHLCPSLAELLIEHAQGQHDDHVFTGAHGGLLRRVNFRDRVWRPAVAGDEHRAGYPYSRA